MKFEYIDIKQLMANPRSAEVLNALTVITSFTRAKAGLSTIRRTRTRAIDSYSKARNQVVEWLEARGYQVFKSGGDWVALKDHINQYVDCQLTFSITESTISATLVGDKNEVDVVVDWIEATFGTLGTLINTAYDITDRGDVVFSSKYMPNSTAKLARQSFYPWLDVPLEEYYKAFMESDESILVLYGPPGVGKSTLLRSLIASGNYDTYLAYAKKVIESPNLITRFYRGSAKILAYEDIDNYLKNREDGNTLMSPFLNSSEGVVQHEGKKIVFSTNLPSIDRIDPALLRRGRCFDILPFRELTRDEAAAVCDDMQMPQKDWNLKDKWPLAEVLSKVVGEQQTVNRYGKRAGFF